MKISITFASIAGTSEAALSRSRDLPEYFHMVEIFGDSIATVKRDSKYLADLFICLLF